MAPGQNRGLGQAFSRLADSGDPLRREKAQTPWDFGNFDFKNFGKSMGNIGDKYAAAMGRIGAGGEPAIVPQAPAPSPQPREFNRRRKSAFPINQA